MSSSGFIPILIVVLMQAWPGFCARTGGFDPDLSSGTIQRLISFRRDLHEHPELSNRETRTMGRIFLYMRGLGLSNVKQRIAKTGVTAVLKGAKPGPTIGLRVPIDAFPIQEKRQTPYKFKVPGVSHACGHDAMTAMELGAAEILSRHRADLAGNVEFIFQPAEEGPPEGEEGGAPLMVKEGVLKGLSALIAFHVDSDIPYGQVGFHEGTVYAGDDDFAIEVKGRSAHGATPWKGIDAIAAASQIFQGLQFIVSRQTDISNPIVLTVGTIQGGIRDNALAEDARLTGTLRTYSENSRNQTMARMAAVVKYTALALGAGADLHYTDSTPPVVNNPDLVKKLAPILESVVGASNVRVLRPMPYSDDFSLMSERVPAFYFQIGIRNDKRGITAGTHTENFDVDENSIPLGAEILARLAERSLRP